MFGEKAVQTFKLPALKFSCKMLFQNRNILKQKTQKNF